MKIKWLVGVFLLSSLHNVYAEAPPIIAGWTYLSGNDEVSEYGKNGSGEISKGIRSMIIQFVPGPTTKDKSVYYSKFTISDLDCKKEYGVIKLYNLSGGLTNNIDYVKGGSSIAASAADLLCSIDFSKYK
ncbi:hypothetical protein [Rahnella victoriana]|uniref:Uncharacterized protein n=1 Tax=Rahnella victoriana TaxID=1510570 RepID=A0ABS0DKX0_9GAMM|nr:hypothetical protein [Rahnella victoriana]MBF7954551.1 hypothetical protein [Rahnella victoriana]